MKTATGIVFVLVFLTVPCFAQTPQIVSTLPTQNQLNVPVVNAIAATFDSVMDAATINDSTFEVNAMSTGLHTGAITYDSPSRTTTFDPDVDFAPGELVTVVLTDGIESGGFPLANPYIWSFSVATDDGAGILATQVIYAAGTAPYSVFVSDLDSDGNLDLATANSGSDNISVLLNDGNRTFVAQVTYVVGSYPSSLFASDLDGDGDLDLATANIGSNNISVLLNNGNGTFAAQVTYTSVSASDLDGDGDLDLATANIYSDNISVLLNNGNGTFAAQLTYAAGSLPFSVFASDLDGDGDLDLATANIGSNNISVLLNNGNGTFAAQVTYTGPRINCCK